MGLLAAGVVIGVLFSPPDPEVVQQALDRVLNERPYQTELPDPRGEADAEDSAPAGDRGRRPHRTGRVAPRRDPRPPRSDAERGPSGSSAVAGALFYVVVGVLAVLFVVWLVSEWKGRARRAPRHPAGPGASPPPPSMDAVPLDEVDALAAAGRFADAIHLLLLRTIAALPQAGAPSAALTSREILARTAFRPGAEEAMGGLVDAVEWSLFGGRPVSEAAYRDCRARFDRFVRVQTGGAA